MLTGELADIAAAHGAFFVASAFRSIIASGQACVLARLVPGRFLFHATRPPVHLVQ
jgi:hypothetical protein